VTLRAVGGTLAKVRVIVVRRAGGKVLARRTVNRLTARRRTVVLRVQGAGRHIRVKATSA
jgi:hypothetical protein